MGFRSGIIDKLDNGEILYESDLLNAILSNAYGGKDMSDVALKLLERFPSVRAIISADYREIAACEGVPVNVARYLKTLGRVAEACVEEQKYIKNYDDCVAFMAKRLCGSDVERVEVYLVSRSGKINAVYSFSSGNADRVEVSVKEILSAVTTSKAYGLYLVHNHVNCPATPSAEDDGQTYKMMQACEMCGIAFLDHIIINSAGETFSYKKSGRLQKLKK